MTSHHVYSCGHSKMERMPIGIVDGAVYIFVEGTCSELHCSITDPAWFSEQHAVPDPAVLNALSDELKSIQVIAGVNLQRFDGLQPMLRDEIEALASPDTVDLLLAQERVHDVNAHCNIPAAISMLSRARGFAKDRAQRPFFHFCLRQACAYIDEAKAKVEALHHVVGQLETRERTLSFPTSAVVCRWPESRDNFEPGFGVEELKLLRLAGEPGISLLEQPLDAGRLQYSTIIVEGMKEKLAASLSTTKPTPRSVEPIDSLEAWLQQEEKAFKLEMALSRTRKVWSKPMRKGPKQGLRINTSSRTTNHRPVSTLRL